ncbi:methyltransferase [Mucilaginibacter mali]|uniref:tRNA1(Val) (adenine(37)-N6)-methyltransferase n=1 Tax=Mucilaginibacter mali TaxID=2740462 RepID=A0A7D4TUX8_9SPHI|nr:methyltransferase [Mucilaginibacter mali]QKJ30055.1 methyltransferase [Mucilaginibacter mali]
MFHFKQFSVDQTGCAMKINTDGVLLGALAAAENAGDILDIGTGTGVIALMLAQRFTTASIDAVEIDKSAAQTAKANFAASPFAGRLKVYALSFERFFEDNPDKKYNLIVSNPPFYINSLKSPGAGKQLAKHADAALFDNMLSGVSAHLQTGGVFWLVLPIDTAKLVKHQAQQYGLNLQQLINIGSYPQSEPHRQLLVFGLTETKLQQNDFVIYDAPKQYTGQYCMALQQFFTIFP